MKRLPASPLDFRNTNTLWCSVLVETLIQCGVRRAVISPGSRSAPLTVALTRHPLMDSIPVLDERSAAFFALGLAKQLGQPVVLVCTSGTAAANYYPAVIEAQESGVPLIVLTADRPPELRACHSGQTIDQVKLYGDHVNHHHEGCVPEATIPLLRYLRQTVAHLVSRSLYPVAGPVHMNCPFRDPLSPLEQSLPKGINPRNLAGFFAGLAKPGSISPVGSRLFTARGNGVIIVGPIEPASDEAFVRSVGRISRSLGWPVLADALSPVRTHASAAGHLVCHYDAILRNNRHSATLSPDQVICIGGWPTSKVLRTWLAQADPETVLISPKVTNEDGLHLRTSLVRGDLAGWSQQFSGNRQPKGQARQWLNIDAAVGLFLKAELVKAKSWIEPQWVGTLAQHLPMRTPCFIASSMPVRDAEYFWPAGNREQRILFNRGANGIDGTLSTALGVAHGGIPSVLVTGDLALLHDTNGFLTVKKLQGSLTIVLINNNGGGIFEHLPVAQFNPPFEEYFATPQNIDFGALCATYGVTHVVVRTRAQLTRLVGRLPPTGVRVLEVRTDRKNDAAFRRDLFDRLATIQSSYTIGR